MVVVADGTPLAAQKLERVLTTDPAMGVLRHVDAGYERAIEVARRARRPRPDARPTAASPAVDRPERGGALDRRRSSAPRHRRRLAASSSGAGISRSVRTGVITSGTTARNEPTAPIQIAIVDAERRWR